MASIYAVRRDDPAQWYDLFCSKDCCDATYGSTQDAILYASLPEFAEAVGAKVLARQKCFECGVALSDD